MKKAYIKPEIVCVLIKTPHILSGSYSQTTNQIETVDDGLTEMGSRHSGSLWDDEE